MGIKYTTRLHQKFFRKIREKINNADVEAARYNIPHLISSLQEASTSSEKVQELVPRVLSGDAWWGQVHRLRQQSVL